MVFVVFDEGCLWCRSLAYLIRRISNVDTVPLRRAVEIFNARLEKGKIYVFDGGVREGLKPLIKLLLARSRLGALRIIPSYTAYKLARGANLKCGCSYGRRLFIKGLISLALTAIITQKIQPILSIRKYLNNSGYSHPFSKVKFKSSRELIGGEFEKALDETLKSKDVGNVVDIKKVNVKNAKAFIHTIDFSNDEIELLAVALPVEGGRESIAYFRAGKPVEWLKTEALLITYESSTYIVKMRSINGTVFNEANSLPISPDYTLREDCPVLCDEYDPNLQCPGPYICASDCCGGTDRCLIICCSAFEGACAGLCFIIGPACIACLIAACPICAWLICCNRWAKECILAPAI
jgi:hypothetical protein